MAEDEMNGISIVSGVFLTLMLFACVSAEVDDEQLLREVDSLADDQRPNLQSGEREDYAEQGFQFDEEMFEQENDDFNDSNDEDGEGVEDLDYRAQITELSLPDYLELPDLRRFLRERENLMARLRAPVEEYQFYLRAFSPGAGMPLEGDQVLRQRALESAAQTHWAYVVGLVQLSEELARRAQTLLNEERKKVIVHHMKTLMFLGRALDELASDSRYERTTKKFYKMIVSRYLNRELRER